MVLGFYLWTFFRAGGSSAPPPRPDLAQEPSYLVAADAHGVVVLDAQHQAYRGVSRDGATSWTSTRAFADGDTLVCARRCPRAVASGGLDALNGIGTPTVTPIPLGGLSATFPAAFKTTVAAIDEHGSVLVQADTAGAAWVLNGQEKTTTGTAQVAVVPSSGGQRLIVGDLPSGETVLRALTPVEDGWHLGPQHTGKGFFGCAGTGDRLAYQDATGVLVAHSGSSRHVSSMTDAGECSFTSTGLVIAQFTAGGTGTTSVLETTDSHGTPRWHQKMSGEARVSGNPTTDEFVATDGKTARVFTLAGHLKRAIKNVRHAVYLPSGHLVVLDTDGTVRWL